MPLSSPSFLTQINLALTHIRHRSKPAESDSDGNQIVDAPPSERETPCDGLGEINLSGLVPPIPWQLIEPELCGHETGFHIITAGTEVGITLFRYAFFCMLQRLHLRTY